MDTLFLAAAFCLLTDQPVTGWLVLGGDSLTIHTSVHVERSKVTWVSPTDAVTNHIENLADYLRSPDPANHIIAATIASDVDFIAAVQVLVDEADQVFAQGFFYLLDVFVSLKISLMVFEAGDERFMTYVPNKDHQVFNLTTIHHPDPAAAALHIKKILCQ